MRVVGPAPRLVAGASVSPGDRLLMRADVGVRLPPRDRSGWSLPSPLGSRSAVARQSLGSRSAVARQSLGNNDQQDESCGRFRFINGKQRVCADASGVIAAAAANPLAGHARRARRAARGRTVPAGPGPVIPCPAGSFRYHDARHFR
ncbi:hypothetical protein [Burkholderia alba]|uniref:hypothetical protein n=1 Tax=Burkholderia alba TaxID=2683677 RepID=UPI002B05B856|nr:hypothetical protein [Burkholderia alba]